MEPMITLAVSIGGCHDTTDIETVVTEAQALAIEALAAKILAAALGSCQPTLEVTRVG